MERFVFRLGYRGSSVTLTVRDGYVSDEFIELAGQSNRTPEEGRRLDQMKQEMAKRVMSAAAADVYDAWVGIG
jgi:hypothetical protein